MTNNSEHCKKNRRLSFPATSADWDLLLRIGWGIDDSFMRLMLGCVLLSRMKGSLGPVTNTSVGMHSTGPPGTTNAMQPELAATEDAQCRSTSKNMETET
jgi:hypothetical protein